MTKADLVQEISKQTGIDRDEVLMIVEAFMETVKCSLSMGKEVYLRGFGKLQNQSLVIPQQIWKSYPVLWM